MLLYLYGDDSYRLQEKLKSIVAQYKTKHSGLAIEHFDMEEKEGLDRLRDFTISQSLFDTAKLGVIRGLTSDNKEVAKLLKNAVSVSAVSLIVVSEKELGKIFNFLLEKPVISQKFEKLTYAQINSFVKKEADKRSVKLSGEEINFLIRANSGDSWGIINDLEKIALGGKVEPVEAALDFISLIKRFLIARPAGAKLAILGYLLENEEPGKIFNVLAAFMAAPSAKQKMADYDVAIKSGKLEYEEALTDLALLG